MLLNTSALFKGDINIASNLEIELDGAVRANLGSNSLHSFYASKLKLVGENTFLTFQLQ